MAGRYTAVIGEPLTLEAQFERDGEPFDVYEIQKIDLVNDDLVTVDTQPGTSVVRLDVGLYEVTFEALTVSGTLSDHWTYLPVEDAEAETATLIVIVAGVEGESPEIPPPVPDPPEIGLENVCKITHTFYKADGTPHLGVYVRFGPEVAPDRITAEGLITQIAEATSDETGYFEMNVIRGAKGLLAVTGVGIVRRVEIPNQTTIDLLDLVATTDDLYEVQRPQFVVLPRRS